MGKGKLTQEQVERMSKVFESPDVLERKGWSRIIIEDFPEWMEWHKKQGGWIYKIWRSTSGDWKVSKTSLETGARYVFGYGEEEPPLEWMKDEVNDERA